MFKKKKKDNDRIESVYVDLIDHLNAAEADSDEFGDLLDRTERVAKLMNEKKPSFFSRISPDAVVGASATIAVTLLIAAIENRHVISTKQFNLIPKPKI